MGFFSHAQITLLGDINAQEKGSNPFNFRIFKQKIVFAARTDVGIKIFAVDSTANNLTVVAEAVNYSNEYSSPEVFVIDSGYLYYFKQKYELWRTDLISHQKIGVHNSSLFSIHFVNHTPVVFSDRGATVPSNGNLWPILNYYFLPIYSIYRTFIPQSANNKLYFFDHRNNNSNELRVLSTNGSLNSALVVTIDSVDNLTLAKYNDIFDRYQYKTTLAIGNIIYFVVPRAITRPGFETIYRNELWKIENEVCAKVKEFSSHDYPNTSALTYRLFELNGKVVIFTENERHEIWVSDGTENGTNFLKSFKTNAALDSYFGVIHNRRLFFTAAETDDYELWATDGTPVNTGLFKDLYLNEASSPSNLLKTNQGFTFQTKDKAVWISDGTVVNTIKLNITLDSLNLKELSQVQFIQVGQRIFGGYFEKNVGREPFYSDDNGQTKTLISNLYTSATESLWYSNTTFTKKYNNKQYFVGYRNENAAIFSTDGTVEGTTAHGTYPKGIIPSEMLLSENRIFLMNTLELRGYFSRNYGIGMLDINTNVYKDIFLSEIFGKNHPIPNSTKSYKKEVVFINGRTQRELWITSGVDTPLLIKSSTTQIKALFTTPNAIYFQSGGLWISDGTANGTVSLTNTTDVSLPTEPENFFYLNGLTYFFSKYRDNQNQNYYGLFSTNGTRGGINLLHTFAGISTQADFSFLIVENTVFFTLKSGSNTQVWRFNGDVNNVKQIGDIGVINTDSFGNYVKFAWLNNVLFAHFNNNSEKNRVVKFSPSSLQPLLIFEGERLIFLEFEVLNNALYFFGRESSNIYGANTRNLYRTDGTAIGTYKIPYNNNLYIDYPILLIPFGNRLLFWGNNTQIGYELFQYTPQLCEATINQTIQSGFWTDQSIWSCGRVPKITDDLIINRDHKVILRNDETGEGRSIDVKNGAVLDIQRNAILKIIPSK